MFILQRGFIMGVLFFALAVGGLLALMTETKADEPVQTKEQKQKGEKLDGETAKEKGKKVQGKGQGRRILQKGSKNKAIKEKESVKEAESDPTKESEPNLTEQEPGKEGSGDDELPKQVEEPKADKES